MAVAPGSGAGRKITTSTTNKSHGRAGKDACAFDFGGTSAAR